MNKQQLQEMEDIMAKISMINERLAYRLKAIYNQIVKRKKEQKEYDSKKYQIRKTLRK